MQVHLLTACWKKNTKAAEKNLSGSGFFRQSRWPLSLMKSNTGDTIFMRHMCRRLLRMRSEKQVLLRGYHHTHSGIVSQLISCKPIMISAPYRNYWDIVMSGRPWYILTQSGARPLKRSKVLSISDETHINFRFTKKHENPPHPTLSHKGRGKKI